MQMRIIGRLIVHMCFCSVATTAFGQDSMPIGTNVAMYTNDDQVAVFRPGVTFPTVNPWSDTYVDSLRPYGVVRMLDLNLTNCNGLVPGSERSGRWADRKQPSDPQQGSFNEDRDTPVAYEYQIDLANQVGADLWLTVPHLSREDPTYFTQLAELVRTRLDPSRRVYIEYSNETWNALFSRYADDGDDPRDCQHTYMIELARSQPWHPLTTLDCEEDPQALCSEAGAATVMASVELWTAFRDVFGSEYETRVYPVLSGWVDVFVYYNAGMLRALDNQDINPLGLMPRGFAVAPYSGNVEPLNPADPASTFALLQNNLSPTGELRVELARTKAALDARGIEFITYEGGQHLTGPGAQDINRMAAIGPYYTQYLEVMDDYFTLFMHFKDRGFFFEDEAFGARERLDSPRSMSPKYDAILRYIEGESASAPPGLRRSRRRSRRPRMPTRGRIR